MSRCHVKLYENSKAIEYKISGCIDESLSGFANLFTGESSLIINLEAVTAINSVGIREWIKLMKMLNNAKILLTHCPKVFIDQVNMVNGMLSENSQIKSFYVPYFSEKKNAEMVLLFEKDIHFSKDFVNYNTTISGDDGFTYDLDVIADRYFKFAKTIKSV